MATAAQRAPEPPEILAPLASSTSRYRSLRGKSVSSPRLRDFNIFHDSAAASKRSTDSRSEYDEDDVPEVAPLRIRSRTVAALRSAPLAAGEKLFAAAGGGAGKPTKNKNYYKNPPSTAGLIAAGLASPHENVPSVPPLPAPPTSTALASKVVNLSVPAKNPSRGLAAARDGSAVATSLKAQQLAAPGHDTSAQKQKQKQKQKHPSILKKPSAAPDQQRPATRDDKASSRTTPAAPAVAPPASAAPPVHEDRPQAARPRDTSKSPKGKQRAAADKKQKQPSEDEAAIYADEVARLEAETDRIIAEQKKLDLARLEASLKTPPKAATRPRPKHLILDKLPFLSRGRRSNGPSSPPGTPITPATTVFSVEYSRDGSHEDALTPGAMSFIEQGGGGIVPQTDAPASAINGGERRVTVRCQSSTINLPVDLTTSPVDIVFSTANLTSHQINADNSIVIECYDYLGIERRLRRYESVRDVMNSWDRDQQNSLLVISHDTPQKDGDLDLKSVPRTQEPPKGFTLQLYYSSRPGRWNCRFVTLSENGQIFAAKKVDGKASDKDSVALCHLSDFDIYTPKESERRRRLRPPKKFCYAIKSQQKTNVFPNGENYIHFFSTDDENEANRFYELVHGWRSWYLVNKKSDLAKKSVASKQSKGTTLAHTKTVVQSGHHRLKVSVDETPYTIGAFQPLVDMSRFDKPIEDFGKDFIISSPKLVQKKDNPKQDSTKQNSAKQTPANKSKVLTKENPQTASAPPTAHGDANFAAGSLLGDAYEKRKNEEKPAQPRAKDDGPFTGGASLLSGSSVRSPGSTASEKPESASWFPSASEHTARVRSHSVHTSKRTGDAPRAPRPKQQPLLNFNANPQPAQNQQRFDRGHGVKVVGGAPLINFATGGSSAQQTPFQELPPRSGARAASMGRDGAPPVSRTRSRARSTAGSQAGGRRHPPEDLPPLPPVPNRSVRRGEGRPQTAGSSSRPREQRPQEPLVNRAK